MKAKHGIVLTSLGGTLHGSGLIFSINGVPGAGLWLILGLVAFSVGVSILFWKALKHPPLSGFLNAQVGIKARSLVAGMAYASLAFAIVSFGRLFKIPHWPTPDLFLGIMLILALLLAWRVLRYPGFKDFLDR